jgi:hypothetical protein
MRNALSSAITYLIANAVGLLLAILLLPGFSVGFLAFLVAVLIFTIVQAIAGPLVVRLSKSYAPQLMGGISLVTIFVGLLITAVIVSGMTIGGISNLLAATLLVWLGSLAADIGLKIAGFKSTPKHAPVDERI